MSTAQPWPSCRLARSGWAAWLDVPARNRRTTRGCILLENPERELTTTDIGESLMDRLKNLDQVAYVRFASVYRDFRDVQAFFDELENLMRKKRG